MTDIRKESPISKHEKQGLLGDISPEDVRRFGHQVVDWIAEYLAHPERYPVLSKARPGDLKDALPKSAPSNGEDMSDILEDLDRFVCPE